jgi:hypothetical protein
MDDPPHRRLWDAEIAAELADRSSLIAAGEQCFVACHISIHKWLDSQIWIAYQPEKGWGGVIQFWVGVATW